MRKIEGNPVLTKKQQMLLKHFGKWEDSSLFYLTGGTALSAFYLQHRFSEDLDFFTEGEVRLEPLLALLRVVPGIEDFSLERKFDRRIFLVRFREGESVRVEFAPYPFKRLDPLQMVEGIQVDSVKDILANKLFALADRKDVKDYIDIFFILRKRPDLSVDQLVSMAEQKFDIKGIYYILQGRFLECPESIGSIRLIEEMEAKEMVSFFREVGKAMVRRSVNEMSNG